MGRVGGLGGLLSGRFSDGVGDALGFLTEEGGKALGGWVAIEVLGGFPGAEEVDVEGEDVGGAAVVAGPFGDGGDLLFPLLEGGGEDELEACGFVLGAGLEVLKDGGDGGAGDSADGGCGEFVHGDEMPWSGARCKPGGDVCKVEG